MFRLAPILKNPHSPFLRFAQAPNKVGRQLETKDSKMDQPRTIQRFCLVVSTADHMRSPPHHNFALLYRPERSLSFDVEEA